MLLMMVVRVCALHDNESSKPRIVFVQHVNLNLYNMSQ